jgi:hypothetical protein
MKVLLDECVNSKLAKRISGHVVSTVTRQHWNGIKNGQLLTRAVDAGFQVFVTIDKSLSFQNHIASFPVAVVVMGLPSNALEDLLPLLPQLLEVLAKPIPGTVTLLGS